MKTTLILLTVLFTARLFAAGPPEEDRRAILAMAGEYRVNFRFEEILSLQNDYERKTDVYEETARELVLVATDSGDRIFLQHLLCDRNGRVIKHWGQLWTWEDTRICEFQGNRTWSVRDLDPEETRGRWTQLVTSVDDSPRYEGIGRWVHAGDTSEWKSEVTSRPLPRREYTKRSDYQLLRCFNRHVLTPFGWAHEQDNTKTQVVDGTLIPLARETGLNTYTRIDDHNFQPARDFWTREGEFWLDVAGAWRSILDECSSVKVAERVDFREIRRTVESENRKGDDRRRRISELLAASLETAAPKQTAR